MWGGGGGGGGISVILARITSKKRSTETCFDVLRILLWRTLKTRL